MFLIDVSTINYVSNYGEIEERILMILLDYFELINKMRKM